MISGSSVITSVPRVLVVEDEAMLRQAVVTGLGRLPGIEVVGTGTVAGALQEIQARVPALIISDIDLPDRSGLELLGELGARGLKPHVVFVSAYVKAYRAQIPPHAGVEVLEKPVALDQLRALVGQRLAQPSSDSSPFGMADYLQLAALGRHSVLIEVAADDQTGQVVVIDGEVWSAIDELGGGMDAFRRMAMAPKLAVRCQTFAGEPGPRNLSGSAEALLLEAARQMDEAGARRGFTELSLDDEPARAGEPIPSPIRLTPPGPQASPLPPSFEEWFDRGVEASLVKDHAAALAMFREALRLRPDDVKTQANINRLEQLLAGR